MGVPGTSLTTIQNEIVTLIPRCPVPYITVMLRETSVTFFRESEVWRRELPAIDIVDGTASYKLTPDVGTGADIPDIWRILTAEINDEVQDPDTYYLDLIATSDVYDWYLVFNDDYVPDADITDGLVVDIALSPAKGSGWSEPFVMHQWSRALVFGTLTRLFSMPSRPWANPEEARNYEDLYEREKARARDERTQQFISNGVLKATNPEGWL